MTPQYILTKSLCREPHCVSGKNWKRTALDQIENLQYAHEYAEPGYTQPTKGILFGNWNYFPRGLDTILERYGYELEWEDEWATCGNCNKAVRTSPDSHGWQPSFAIENNCEITCIECLKDSPESYLESLEDKPTKALNLPGIDPAECGYIQLKDGFESGLHPGQNDNPKEIYKSLREQGHTRILFQIDSVRQFDTSFSVWEKTPDQE